MCSVLVLVVSLFTQPAIPTLPKDFLVSETIGMLNSTSFVFVDVTEGASIPVWDFGDGVSTQGRQVSHKYERVGKFTIKMKSGDKEYVKENYIEVLDFPGVFISVDPPVVKFNEEFHVYDNSPENLDPRIKLVSSYWDFGDGTTAIGKDIVHKYPQPKEYEISLKKTYKVALENSTEVFKDIVAEDFVRVIGLSIYVNSANTNPVQDGLSWPTAYSDIRSALDIAASDDIRMVFVANSPIELSTSLQDEWALRIPSGVAVAGGFDPSNISSSSGFAGMPKEEFSGTYTPIKVKGSPTAMRSLKYVVNLEGVFSGFDIQMKNDKNSGVSGVKCSRNSSLINSKISVFSEGGSSRNFFGIDIDNSDKVVVEGIRIDSVRGFGSEGAAIRVLNSSNLIMSRVSVVRNSMRENTDGYLVYIKNGRAINFDKFEAKYNDLGSKSGVVTIITENGSTITESLVFTNCLFDSNQAGNGSAIFIDRSGGFGNTVVISRSVFMNNKSDGNESKGGALFVRSGNVSLEHSLLFGNQAYMGNALYFAGDFMRVTHCTFANVGVSTKALADIRVDQKGLCIDNSILYSEGPFTVKESSVAANPSVFGCVIFPSPLAYAEKCVVADPLFVNQSMMDFRISSKSPCIDSAVHGEFPYYAFLNGKSSKSTLGGSSDIRRSSGGDLPDIGAFEYSKEDPGFFLNSDENGKLMSKQNAETFQKLFDTVDNFMKSGKMNGKPFEIPAELRKSVSDSLKVNE